MKIKFKLLGTRQGVVRIDFKEVRQSEQELPAQNSEPERAKPVSSSKLLENAIPLALWRDKDANVNGF